MEVEAAAHAHGGSVVAGERSSGFRRSTAATQAFDINTGEEQSRMSLGGSLQSTPIVTEEAVYLATYPGVVYAVR